MKNNLVLLLAIVWLLCANFSCEAQEQLYAPIQSKLYTLTNSSKYAGSFPCLVNPRAFGIMQTGTKTLLVYWNSVRQMLIVADNTLKTIRELSLQGSSVWIHKENILTVSRTWENGFTFTLYRLNKSNAISIVSTWHADLFLSDVVINNDGVLLAGGTNDDSTNKVLWCAIGKQPEQLLTQAKDGDFLRLLQTDQGIYVYGSAQEKTTRTLRVWYIEKSKAIYKVAAPVTIMNLKEIICWYGSGFFWNGNIYVPAWNGSEIQLTQFAPTGSSLVFIKAFKNAYGIYYPLGQAGTSFWYISYDYYTNSNQWFLSKFDGVSITQQQVTAP